MPLKKVSVSVIITCHNLEEYLKDAVESVYSQTFPATEIIIVHDACNSPTAHAGATTVIREDHKGVVRTRHEGVLLSTSDNIIFLDADDKLSENFIEQMVRTKEDTGASVIYPNVLLWSRWHKELKLQNKWHESPNEITWDGMWKQNEIVVTSMIEKSMYEALGGFKTWSMLEDYDFWLKAIKAGYTFAKASRCFLHYRMRKNGRNRQPDELKNQMYYEIRSQYETV